MDEPTEAQKIQMVQLAAGQVAGLLEDLSDDGRVTLMADLHDMSADLPPGARRLLSLALAVDT